MNTNFTNKIFLMLYFYLLFSISSPPILQVLSHSTFSPKPSLESSLLETLLHFQVIECMFLSLFLILSSHVLDFDFFISLSLYGAKIREAVSKTGTRLSWQETLSISVMEIILYSQVIDYIQCKIPSNYLQISSKDQMFFIEDQRHGRKGN